MFRRHIFAGAAVVALAVGVLGTVATQASAAPANAPSCTTGTFTVNSGGPTYKDVRFCNFTRTTNKVIVDATPLQNGAVLFGYHVATHTGGNRLADRLAASNQYPDPNGPNWNCQEYKTYYSWDCIASSGFLYGGMWAFTSAFYEHPNPDTDYTVIESYLNQVALNGMTKTAQWRHRVIVVDDPAVQGAVEPFLWKVSAGDTNPPAPTTCLVLTGDLAGQQISCSPLVQTSILDYWHRANQIPSQDAW